MSRDAETEKPDDDGRELDQQLGRYLQFGLPIATLVCAIVAGVLQGAAAVVLVLAAGTLVTVIAVFWASVRTLVGETVLSGADAYALGAPRAEEEQKRAVLRALKDLEFERSVGKISEEDYRALVAKYRAEGKRLIRLLDEDAEPRRQKVEDLVAARLFEEGLAERPPDPYRGADPKDKKPKEKRNRDRKGTDPNRDRKGADPSRDRKGAPPDKPEDTRPACPSCGTRNDPDAVFCKKCGARQGEEPIEDEEENEPEAREQEKTS